MPNSKQPFGRFAVLALVSVVPAAIGGLWWALRPEPPAAESRAEPEAAAAEPGDESPPSRPRRPQAPSDVPSGDEPPPQRLEVPLPRVSGLEWVSLDAQVISAPSSAIRVLGTAADPVIWRALLDVAVAAAGTGRSLQIELDVRGLPPALEYALPLALAIRLELAQRLWPQGVLVAGFPGPDGSIFDVSEARYVPDVAAKAGRVLDRARDLEALFASWAPGLTDRWSGCAEAARPAGDRLDGRRSPLPALAAPDALARSLDEAIGSLAAGGPPPRRQPEDHARRLRALEGALSIARLEESHELIGQAWMAGEIRAAVRLSDLVAERIPTLDRVVRSLDRKGARRSTGRPAELEPGAVAWITSLLSAELEAKAVLEVVGRDAARLPPGPRSLVTTAAPQVAERTAALTTLGDATAALLNWRVPQPRRLPHPYPWMNLGVLDAARPMPPASRHPVAELGTALVRAATTWAALAQVVGFAPRLDARTGTFVLSDLRAAREALALAEDRVQRCLQGAARRLGAPPREVQRRLATSLRRTETGPADDVVVLLARLTDTWQAAVMLDEAALLD